MSDSDISETNQGIDLDDENSHKAGNHVVAENKTPYMNSTEGSKSESNGGPIDKTAGARDPRVNLGFSAHNEISQEEIFNVAANSLSETDILKNAKVEMIELEEKKLKEDKSGEEDKKKEGIKPEKSPMEDAFIISKYLTFWWLSSLFSKGSRQKLQQDDLYDIPDADRTQGLCEMFESHWAREAYDEDGNIRPNASLAKVFWKSFGLRYMLLGIINLIMEGLRLVRPILLGKIVSYFSPKDGISKKDAYIYGFFLVLCTAGITITSIPLQFLRQRIGMQARTAVTALIYKKVLRLSNSALASTTTGYILNVVSTDTQKIDFACMFIHYIWLSPLIVIVAGYLVWDEIGVSSLAGIGLMLLLAPLQMGMGTLLMAFRRNIVKYTDKRVKIMNEVVTGMRVIKLYTWEDSFIELVDKLRASEIKAISNLLYMRAGFMSFFFSSSSLVSFVTFLTYSLSGNLLTSQKVFTCVSLFHTARLVMTLFFPIAITLFNEARVAVERMEKLLRMKDISNPCLPSSNLRPKPKDCGVTVTNLIASWREDATTLDGISFSVGEAELVAVVGSVGAGKSSLLMAILGELQAKTGSVDVKGKIAYSSQESWIFNGSIKNNITFGQEYDQEKYKKVLEVCALERDIKLFPDGDMTLVGERGVALSGGQKARVTLARAVYCDADIYILDDPLSAVDAHVGRHLFNECITGYLANKPKILVTHQIQYLTDADEILVISKGKCIGQGTYNELTTMGIDFITLLTEEDEQLDFSIEGYSNANQGVGGTPSLQHRFSRQKSAAPELLKERTTSFQREASMLSRQGSISYRERNIFRSDISITQDVKEVDIFQERELPMEKKIDGAVTVVTYLKFFKSGYGVIVCGLVVFLFIICQVIYVLADWWLSVWSTAEEKYAYAGNDKVLANKNLNRSLYLGIYGGLVAALLFLGITRALLFFKVFLKSSQNIHGMMFRSVLRAPMYFFDTNSVGRILNRFSKDMSLVDDQFSFVFFDFLQTILVVLGILVLVCANNPIVLSWTIPLLIMFFILRKYYIQTAREVKRIEGIVRSPVYGHFSTTLLGLPTIRAFRVQPQFTDYFYEYQDGHNRAWFSFLSCSQWLAFWLEVLLLIFIALVVFVCIAISSSLNGGQVGLILSYTMNITGVFQQCVRQSTEVENQMTSVERVLEYSELVSEAPSTTDNAPPSEWPKRGSIQFKDMSFSYASHLPPVLHKVSCNIHSAEKVGVCGRTGAGKSSLLSTLFRLAEPNGSIKIDNTEILNIGLKELRSKISIIPQDPVLFSGTLRKNLDPFNAHDDLALWTALEEVQLKEVIEALPGKLETQVAEAGANLSVGERQLACLARAILRHNKILVIDEATANVDPITDGLIQTTIREKFKECTVLTIAHRLNTIMDSDRIMVLDAGHLKEYDEPYSLLCDRHSVLYDLVQQTGRTEAQKLFETARKTFFLKRGKKGPDVLNPAGELGASESVVDSGQSSDSESLDQSENGTPSDEQDQSENGTPSDEQDQSENGTPSDEQDPQRPKIIVRIDSTMEDFDVLEFKPDLTAGIESENTAL